MVAIVARSDTECKSQVVESSQDLFPSDLKTLQANYGASCSKYEQFTEKKLARSDTIIVSGIGCALRVHADALTIFPGKTHAAGSMTPRKLYRGVHSVSHIVLLADRKGLVTLDAIKFCTEQDIAITVLDDRGSIIQSLSTCHADAKLRRAQYAAHPGKISCELLHRKVTTQLDTLEKHPELPGRTEAMDILSQAVKWFDLPTMPERFYDVSYLRSFEGRCADAYWRAWQGLPIKWDKTVKRSVPPHWLTIAQRGSPLSKGHGARWAVNPAHALLNYALAILESQVRQALNAVGFDCTCGFLHADQQYKDTLVFDLQEVHRAAVEDKVLKFLASTTFSKGDLMSRPSGEVRFNPQLSRYIAATCRLPQSDVDTSAKWMKEAVMSSR
jgi:CRISPR-associated protein Cas1